MRRASLLLWWWFLYLSPSGQPVQVGPFASETACEAAREVVAPAGGTLTECFAYRVKRTPGRGNGDGDGG